MADGYLERHQEEYEARKAAWLRKKKMASVAIRRQQRPNGDASGGQTVRKES